MNESVCPICESPLEDNGNCSDLGNNNCQYIAGLSGYITEKFHARLVHIALDIQKIIHEKRFKTYYEETVAIVKKIEGIST